MKSAEAKITTDPSNFWRFVNQRRNASRIPGDMIHNDTNLHDPQDIVNGFADHFSSVFRFPSDYPFSSNDMRDYDGIDLSYLSEDDIINACRLLKPSLVSGYDLIPAFLVRDCSHVFAPVLKIIFNCSIKTNTFPDCWKSANVCPIFKSGKRSFFSNYRPISLLSNFSKIFERAIYNQIHIAISSKLPIHQHGFLKGRSTTTNLVSLTQFIAENIDAKSQVDVIYTDFARAFDNVNFNILLEKLRSFGFAARSLTFFYSYLRDRSCSVVYNGFQSKIYRCTSGVPQGSVLGPILFLIFINDLANLLGCHKLLFADDLKLFASINQPTDCLELQGQVNTLQDWCRSSGLDLNISKCSVMTYTRKRNPIMYNYIISDSTIQRKDHIIDLGVTFDTKLRFNLHVESKVTSAMKMLGFVIRTGKHISSVECLKLLFCAFVRSILEYACSVWSPQYNCYIDALEYVQRRFLKFLYFKIHKVYPPQGYPQELLISEFGLTPLETRRKCFDIKFLNKVCHNELQLDNNYFNLKFYSPRENSRHRAVFKLPRSNTNVLENSPLVKLCTLGNKCIELFNVTEVSCSTLNRLLGKSILIL